MKYLIWDDFTEAMQKAKELGWPRTLLQWNAWKTALDAFVGAKANTNENMERGMPITLNERLEVTHLYGIPVVIYTDKTEMDGFDLTLQIPRRLGFATIAKRAGAPAEVINDVGLE